MKSAFSIIFALGAIALGGNFFSFWSIPGLEGMETFQERKHKRDVARQARYELIGMEDPDQTAAKKASERRSDALKNGGGLE